MNMTPSRIISGGQTGVDRGALDAARDNGFPCGGWCAAGRKAENGRIPKHYPLIELEDGGYAQRTLKNVQESDGTLILYRSELHGGTQETLRVCIQEGKPCKLIDAEMVSVEQAVPAALRFLSDHGIATLNVAGPRASNWPQAHDVAYSLVSEIINGVRQPHRK